MDDLFIELMKSTYMMDLNKIKSCLWDLWLRYQKILNSPNWEDLNEARSILFLTGHIYCEQIAVGAIERRLSSLNKESLPLNEFLVLVDSNSEKLEELRKNNKFKQLEDFYNIIKLFKNTHTTGKYYIDEERFIEMYNQHAPSEIQKTAYKGIIERKTEA